MSGQLIQRALFGVSFAAALANPFIGANGPVNYIVLAGAMLYLLAGWLLPIVEVRKASLKNELAGFVYSTVLMANFMDAASLPLSREMLIFGDILAIGMLVWAAVKRKELERGVLVQAIIVFLISPIPMWI